VELNEAVLRILRHSRLIIAVVLVCLSIPLLTSGEDDTYVASARVSFGPDASNEDEAAAMVDTAEAIVTTPGEIEAVLARHGVDRDPARVEDQVDVESVGVSGVLTISASDTDPEVAAAVANGMARRFLAARRELVLDPLEERLQEVDDQLALVSEDIRTITQTGSSGPAALETRRLRLDAALNRQSGLRNELERLNTTLDATPRPSLLATATVPTVPEPSGLAADLMVAGLLGLIIGVALTAVIEALRPTIVGRDALARTLGAPVLGQIPNPLRAGADLSDNRVALPLALAAKSARIDVVHLTSVGPTIDLVALAEHLGDGAPKLTVDTIGTASAAPSRPGSSTRPSREGLVAVAPEVQPRSAFGDLEQLLDLSQWPLVGIITYPSPIWRRHPGPGRVHTLLRRARMAMASMIDRRRRAPQHAGASGGSKAIPHAWLRFRRLVRVPWGSESQS
jgi:capsular polysaccharide biosynthesis protein